MHYAGCHVLNMNPSSLDFVQLVELSSEVNCLRDLALKNVKSSVHLLEQHSLLPPHQVYYLVFPSLEHLNLYKINQVYPFQHKYSVAEIPLY